MNNEKYTAIIIEPRVHTAFKLVLENFLTHLDDQWDIIIFHGNLNKQMLEELVDSDLKMYKSRIKMIHMKVDNLSFFDYNSLLRCKKFYEYIPTEMFLVFQLDTLISDVYKNNIYDFMQYDYVGAPWPMHFPDLVGNGGLSLRRKSKMLQILDEWPIDPRINEDMYFASYTGLYKPSYQDAKNFSVECIYHDKSFGIHQCWEYMSDEQMQIISRHIPQIFELKHMYSQYTSGSCRMSIMNISEIF
jgi:hypothetical protein